jgi:hypothetical protein
MQHTKLVLEVWGKTAAENAPIARPIKTNGTDENTCQNISHLKFARANGRICQKKNMSHESCNTLSQSIITTM